MAIEISVPRLGWSMDEGTLLEWFKREGEFVRKGEMIFSLEGDKATQEIESFDEGYLRLFSGSPQPGEAVKVGQVLAFLLAEGESLPPLPKSSKPSFVPTHVHVESQLAEAIDAAHQVTDRAATPRARRTARRLGVDWQSIQGTGRNGRVRERDVLLTSENGSGVDSAMAHPSPVLPAIQPLPGQIVPFTSLRRTIAARMTAANQQTVPVTLSAQADATQLVTLRKSWRQARTPGDSPIPSHTDMILKLVSMALTKHPAMQTQWRAEGLFVPEVINIAMAVDTEAGLVVPVVRNVPSMTIMEVTIATRKLIELAHKRRLTLEQTRGGTFTVSSLGSFGIDMFTPIIHLPQSAILGIGRIALEPAVVGDQVVPRHRMWLSLTFDHRVIDGAPAARFLAAVKDLIETPDFS